MAEERIGSQAPVLRLEELTRTVVLPDGQDLHILRGINLEVRAGEHVAVVGRSGTGKSTLLNLVGLLDAPTSGNYQLSGKSVLGMREGKRARLRGSEFGFVFQQFNLFGARTVLENVEVPLLYANGRKFWKRASLSAAMLDRVGLGDRLESYPTEMSGGEQQRIAIARALVREPRVILADEPTGALDPETGQSVMSLLEEVARERNAALIVITHDLNVAMRATKVLSLSEGVLHPVEDVRSQMSVEIAAAGPGVADSADSADSADGAGATDVADVTDGTDATDATDEGSQYNASKGKHAVD